MESTDLTEIADLGIDMSQTLAPGVSAMLSAGGILLLTALIVMTVVIFQRWKGRFIPMLLGVVAYIIFVFIFSNLVMSALLLIPSFDVAFENNPVVYPILYTILTAIGLTVARILVGLMISGRYERQGDVMLAGIGVSLGDAFLYGMTTITYIVMTTGIENLGLASLFVDMTAEEIQSTYEGMSLLFSTPAFVWLIVGVGAVLDVVLCIALMFVVYGAMTAQIPKIWIFFSGLIQCAVSLPLQIVDTSNIISVLAAFLIKAVAFVAAVGYIYKFLAPQMTYNNK